MTAGETDKTEGRGFRATLTRVLIVQLVALALLWALQARYHIL